MSGPYCCALAAGAEPSLSGFGSWLGVESRAASRSLKTGAAGGRRTSGASIGGSDEAEEAAAATARQGRGRQVECGLRRVVGSSVGNPHVEGRLGSSSAGAGF